MKAAVYCGTRNVYENMVTSAKSLLYHNKLDKVYFLTEDDDFFYELPPIIECINVKQQNIFSHDGPNFNCRWSYMILMRAAFTKILPQELNKILSLDIDTIVNTNIEELWKFNLDNYYYAAVPEPLKTKNQFLYTNVGVMMVNLKKMREDKKDDELIYDLNHIHRNFPEQDCFNALCQSKIKILPGDYNVCPFTTRVWENEKITHYANISSQIWSNYDKVKEYKEKSWEEILKNKYD